MSELLYFLTGAGTLLAIQIVFLFAEKYIKRKRGEKNGK